METMAPVRPVHPKSPMVAVFAAVLSWESSSAQDILLAVHERYARSANYEAKVAYSLNKTRMNASPTPGSTESQRYSVRRHGDSYTVHMEGRAPWAGRRESASTDPFLAYDHELTRWFGFRKKRLTLSLLPPDSRGPVYSLLRSKALPQGCIAVVETYTVPNLPAFRFTTVVDEARQEVRSISSFGTVIDVADSGTGPGDRQGVIWSETIEFSDQKF